MVRGVRMNRTELLAFMKGKISTFFYDILVAWTKKREKVWFGFADRVFDVEPHNRNGCPGYQITGENCYDYIIVLPEGWTEK
jgi:hypothetical protein